MWWLTFDTPRGLEVFVVQAGYLSSARMKAGVAGQEGKFQEGHKLDAKMAKQVPANLIGKTLSRQEAERLLKRLG
jgi:hypothetical protein